MVFCTDPSLGNLHYAEKIFNYIQIPSLFIYNMLIKAFAKKGSFRKAIWVFGQLRKHGLWPDNFTYPYIFKAIGCLGESWEGAKVHGFVVKTGLEFDTYICNSLMDMYGELGKVENFKKLFNEKPERDRVSWNVMISGYVRRRRSLSFQSLIPSYLSLGIAQPKGVLLYGPPGTGKRLLARAVAYHTDCTFIRASGSELVQNYIGEGSRMVRELFVMVREHTPSIIFMDEIHTSQPNIVLPSVKLFGYVPKLVLCTKAGMFALRERRVHVTQEDFEMVVAKVMKKETEKNVSLRKLW
nr:26s protease regulatory subunit 8 like a [Quercus suber]